ncbi:MAG: beta-propeller domain-containing protein [Thermoplasmata archaeon]
MKTGLLAVIITVSMVFGGIVGILALHDQVDDSGGIPPYEYQEVSYSNLQKFGSYQEIKDFLARNNELSGYEYYYPSNLTKVGTTMYGPSDRLGGVLEDSSANLDSSGSDDHSQTNVQVEGVDEGDIVKNDGKYAYIVSRNKTKVIILDVYPAENAKILSIIEVDLMIREIYLNDGKLVVLGTNSYYYDYYWGIRLPNYLYSPETYIKVYDIEDRENPVLYRSVELKGSYVSSRMIGDYLYLIVTQYSGQIESETDLPASPSEIYYTDEYDYYYTYTSIISINVQNAGEELNKQVVLMGSSTHIYVSLNNIYLTYTKRMSWVEKMERRVEEVIMPVLPKSTSNEIEDIRSSDLTRYEKLREIDSVVGRYTEDLSDEEEKTMNKELKVRNDDFEQKIQVEIEKTIIHRIYINGRDIQYITSGGVPGYVLNRFSMDEYNRHFRIATTTGQLWGWGDSVSRNHVFVLNLDLKTVGKVTDIAPGETIYSARFMGNRGYLVTFKKIDPFFVIDISIPESPQVLGKLKIPGYSNYLHPYDENHVIGIGKDAVDMGDFAWYQGVKLSLFDVSDVNNPKEVSNYIVGDRGTDSLALSDPHAFLFSRSRNLLVIPIVLAEIDETKYPEDPPPQTFGEYTWCGAYVFAISRDGGINLRGGITHVEDSQVKSYWYYSPHRIKRSFYIEDTLYTVSDSLLKANSLNNLNEINAVALPE